MLEDIVLTLLLISLVFTCTVFIHFPDPSDVPKKVKKIFRTLVTIDVLAVAIYTLSVIWS